ncbi:uncharacterized protein [Amphiura filiformis]|uniref:uncharacterized protein isoform X1 n=1 Tax=Amphiura filiformis TaxID=82378 RepID=UPI003B224704
MSTPSPASTGIRRPVGSKSKRTKAPPPPSAGHPPPVTSPVNGTSHHAPGGVNGIGGTNGVATKHEDTRAITVVLPDGRNVKATVANNMPMLDLLVLIGAKNRLNPASYTIARIAHDLNGEVVQIAPHKCVGDIDEEDMFKVVPKNTQEHFTLKRDKKKSAIFDQTIRLTVITDKSHRLVVRVNPSRPLLELFPVICKERGVEQAHHVLRLVSKPHEPLNMRESLTSYGVTELLLVDTRGEESSDSDPEGPPGMHEKKKKSGFFSRLSRKKKGYELGGGGGESVIPTSTTRTASKSSPPNNNNVTVPTKETLPHSQDPNTSTVSRNVSVSKKRRPAPKPPGAKTAPPVFSPNEDKGIVSHTGSLKKRRAPPPPKVPDTIVETPDSPIAVSSDGHFDTTTSSNDTSGIVTSTPMYHDNESGSSSPSPSRPEDPPPPPPPEFGESGGEDEDDGKVPSKPSRSLSFEGLEDSQEEDGSEFDFPPPPPELQQGYLQNTVDSDSNAEYTDASVEEEVAVEEETIEEDDIQVEVEENLEAEPEIDTQASSSRNIPPGICAYCRNPENGECECIRLYSNMNQTDGGGDGGDGDERNEEDKQEEEEEEGEEEEGEDDTAQVTSPAPGNQSESTTQTIQSQDSFLPANQSNSMLDQSAADQSHSMLDTDSIDFSSGGGGIDQLKHSPESGDQSEDSDVEDGFLSANEPVVLIGIKRLVSQSTATEFSSDSEYDDTTRSDTPPSSGKYKPEDDSGVIITEWTDYIEGATPPQNDADGKTMQVSEEQEVVADEYQEKGNKVFLATTGSGEVKVEGYNHYSGTSHLQVLRSDVPQQGHAKLSKLALYADVQSKNQTKAERQVALSRMMKLSFEVEDSNETTNCSPSPHPEKDINMLEEKSLHALAYDVKRMPVSIEEGEEVEADEEETKEEEDKDEDNETKDNQPQGEVGLSIEALREQYITLQQQMSMLQQQLSTQQQPAGGATVNQPMNAQQPMNIHVPADANLYMQQLQQQQMMMQQMMLQQNTQGIPMMMPQPGGGIIYGMVPVAPAPTMQTNVASKSENESTDEYCEQTDIAIQHTPSDTKTQTKDVGNKSDDLSKNEVKPEKSNLPFKMLSQEGSQNKGKSLKYWSYIMSRET